MIRMRWAAAAVGYATATLAKSNDQMGLFRLYVMCSIMATYCDMYNCTPRGRFQSQIASCQKNRERNQRLQPKVANFHSQHATRNWRLRIQIPISVGCLFLIALRVAVFYFFWLQQKSCIKKFRNLPSLVVSVSFFCFRFAFWFFTLNQKTKHVQLYICTIVPSSG